MMRICIAIALFAALAACAATPGSAGSRHPHLPAGADQSQMLVMAHPPEVVAKDPADLPRVRLLMRSIAPEELRQRRGAHAVGVAMIPWISGSDVGREYLRLPPQRVLVRGDPARACPVAFAVHMPRARPIADVAAGALESCIAKAGPGCGCKLIAAGAVLMVPLDELSYATGAAARLQVPSLDLNKMLVAEAVGDDAALLRDVGGIVGRVTHGPDGAVTVRLDGIPGAFVGTGDAVGFRRGRVAWRIHAKNPAGRRLNLLIGFSPAELTSHAAAWLAWPNGA